MDPPPSTTIAARKRLLSESEMNQRAAWALNRINLPPDGALADLYLRGWSSCQISRLFGVTPGDIIHRLHRGGCAVRTAAEVASLKPTGAHSRPYRKLIQKSHCRCCASREHLAIHHADLDHYNNEPGNLIVLCRSCHASVHAHIRWNAIRAGVPVPKSNGPVGWLT